MTKTTRSGQPFAVLLAGFTADTATSSWVFHWLRALHQAREKLSHFDPDFIIPTMDSLRCPTFSSPLSYAAALRALRWACQTPWDRPRLSSSSAQNFTLHSLKVSMLSVAAQLRLPHKDRQIQGHHTGGSVQLYSRDDTIDALWVQTQISTSVRLGCRPMRPQHLQDKPLCRICQFHMNCQSFPLFFNSPTWLTLVVFMHLTQSIAMHLWFLIWPLLQSPRQMNLMIVPPQLRSLAYPLLRRTFVSSKMDQQDVATLSSEYTSGSFIPLGGNDLDTPLWSLFKEVGCLSPAIRDPRALQETSLQGCFWQSACLLSAVKHP